MCNAANFSITLVIDDVEVNGVGSGVITYANNTISVVYAVGIIVEEPAGGPARVQIQRQGSTFISNDLDLPGVSFTGQLSPDPAMRMIRGRHDLLECDQNNDFSIMQFLTQSACASRDPSRFLNMHNYVKVIFVFVRVVSERRHVRTC